MYGDIFPPELLDHLISNSKQMLTGQKARPPSSNITKPASFSLKTYPDNADYISNESVTLPSQKIPQYSGRVSGQDSRSSRSTVFCDSTTIKDRQLKASSDRSKKVTFKDSLESLNSEDQSYSNDLRRGERIANIPSTSSERHQALLLEACLEKALRLWPKEAEEDLILEEAMTNFRAAEIEGAGDFDTPHNVPITASVFERGTYNGLFMLPWMAELKRRFPRQVLLRNVKLALLNSSTEWIDDPEGENVPLFLVHWGIVQDPNASKRRQQEKQVEEKWQEETHEAYSHQVRAESVYSNKHLGRYSAPVATGTSTPCIPPHMTHSSVTNSNNNSVQRCRPIVKTSHLRCQQPTLPDTNIEEHLQTRLAQFSGGSSSGISSRDSISPVASLTTDDVFDDFFCAATMMDYANSKSHMNMSGL